jgi:flavodoxin
MKALIVYTSKTGNTKKVAEAMLAALPAGSEIRNVSEAQDQEGFGLIILGFWIDRARMCQDMREFLPRVKNNKAAFFFTQVGWPNGPTAKKITASAEAELAAGGNEVLGSFHCQGRMSPMIVQMAKMLPPTHPRGGYSFHQAALLAESELHPDDGDLREAAKFADRIASSA